MESPLTTGGQQSTCTKTETGPPTEPVTTRAETVQYAYAPGRYERSTETTTVAGQTPVERAYGYDEATRRLATVIEAGDSPEAGATYQYDAAGNVERVVSPEGSREYDHDALNQLTSVSVTDGVGTTTELYAFDHAGRRVTRTLGSTASEAVYAGDTMVAEYDDTGTPTTAYHGLGKPAAVDDLTGGETARQHYLYGALGTVQGLSDPSGALAVGYQIDAFGRIGATFGGGENDAPASTANRRGFTGHWHDPSGLVHMGARSYEPRTGLFLSVDPHSGFHDKPFSLLGYQYAYGNPGRYVDPDGRAVPLVGAAVAAGWYLLKVGAESAVETGIEAGIAHLSGDESFSWGWTFAKNMAVNTATGWIPGAVERKIAGKLALTASLNAAEYGTKAVVGGATRITVEAGTEAAVQGGTRLALRAGAEAAQVGVSAFGDTLYDQQVAGREGSFGELFAYNVGANGVGRGVFNAMGRWGVPALRRAHEGLLRGPPGGVGQVIGDGLGRASAGWEGFVRGHAGSLLGANGGDVGALIRGAARGWTEGAVGPRGPPGVAAGGTTPVLRSGTSPLKQFDIDRYSAFNTTARRGDQLAGHELLQNAWMKQRGLAPRRGAGVASRDNPAVALSRELHEAVGREQAVLGLNDPARLQAMSASQNIEANVYAMRAGGVPEDVIQTLRREARQHAADVLRAGRSH